MCWGSSFHSPPPTPVSPGPPRPAPVPLIPNPTPNRNTILRLAVRTARDRHHCTIRVTQQPAVCSIACFPWEAGSLIDKTIVTHSQSRADSAPRKCIVVNRFRSPLSSYWPVHPTHPLGARSRLKALTHTSIFGRVVVEDSPELI